MNDFWSRYAAAEPVDFSSYRLAALSREENKCLRDYKANFDQDTGQDEICWSMNRGLRLGLFPDEFGTNERALCEGLDKIFTKAPQLTHSCTVVRGDAKAAFVDCYRCGTRFRSASFWSTAVDPIRSESFFVNGGALLKLYLPAGLPVYNIETRGGGVNNEAELLLPRGVLWTVRSWRLIPVVELPPYPASKLTEGAVGFELEASLPVRPAT